MVLKATIVPFLGILFVGAAALVIAATVVLALIPIYIQKNSVATSTTTAKDLAFYVQYSSDLDADTDDDSATGNITNTNEIAQSLGVGNQVQILGAQAQTSFVRRRRDTSHGRHKRGVTMNILLQCAPLANLTCFTQGCLQRTRNQAIVAMQQSSNLTSVPFTITTGGVPRRIRLRLVYIGVVLMRPDIGFAGEVPSLAFVATQSGPFTNLTTWNGTMPYGNCSIIIPAGITVTLSRPIFELRMRQCDIFGTLIVGGSNNEFRFNFPSAIVVHSGGNLIDASANKTILLPGNSLLMVHPNASVGSSGTTIQTYTRNGTGIRFRNSTATIPSSGPHTCGILRSGAVIAENKILFIATGIGSILRGSTFLGGVGPTAALCDAVGPCGLNIQPGATVDTEDLDDDFNINFDVINILSGGTFAIGKTGSSKGIKFKYRFSMLSSGFLRFRGAGGSILLAVGSQWSFLAGGGFSSLVAVAMQTYNSVTGSILNTVSLGLSFFGPAVYIISSSGQIFPNVTSTTPMPATTIGLG